MKKENKKKIKLKEIILPNKKFNYFVASIILLGIISGSIFLMLSTTLDKNSVIKTITAFFTSISKNTIDNGLAFKNSLIINYLFTGLIFIFGLSMIGVVFNIFIAYLKGFLVGFSIASIFLSYKLKGFLAVLLYTFPSQILNLLTVFLLSIYSIMFSSYCFKIIFAKKKTHQRMLKKYLVILMFCIILSFISSILEVYLFPKILKLFISLYVK